eukprot:TRINITY_DN557_c0_g2_i1.p1 TRINITY_DN557_c0_g2~~TRINITY_DN557_c0_g2_i1.p1  ORF type:complete len:498 (-),score=188.84 TRINITY_DN557_c0_g2_i1:264-1757(-)
MKKVLFFLLLVILSSLCFSQAPLFNIAEVNNFKLINQNQQSQLYQIELQNGNNGYDDPILMIVLRGSNFQRGYDYAYLLCDAIQYNFNSLIDSFIPQQWQKELVFKFLDNQWEDYLSKQIPQQFIEELEGIATASKDKKVEPRFALNILIQRALVLANFPGDFASNVFWLLYDQQKTDLISDQTYQSLNLLKNQNKDKNMHCSMFGVWGSRTINGNLYSMRNLDWLANVGISKYKLLTIYHEQNKYSYATIGFAGLIGALTGISNAGVTVHEAGNDVNKETFDGFTWTLRLRSIMAQYSDLQSIMKFWNATNNTLGMNHGIGSAKDSKFLCLETMANYTAVFADNDTREANYIIYEPSTSTYYQLGKPLVDAVWRTNNGFDPQIVAHEIDPPISRNESTAKRYTIIHDSFTWYEQQNILIGPYEAINVTSILGNKGSDFYSCQNTTRGTNILSVTYDPNNLEMYVAFEQGGVSTSSIWKPACCGTYIHIDLKSIFTI